MQDVGGSVPVKRMSVARGRMTGLAQAPIDIGTCEAAAKLAVKQCHLTVPDLHPVLVDHIDVLAEAEGDALAITVTVQAHARGTLEGHAIAGVMAALLAARTAAGVDARIEDVHLVQNVA